MSGLGSPKRLKNGTFTHKDLVVPTLSVDLDAGLDSREFPDVGSADVAELRFLADSPDPLVRADLLSSPRLPNDVLHKLFEEDESLTVKISAVNEGNDSQITAKAARHENPFIRAAAFGRHDLTSHDREQLRGDAGVQRLMGVIAR